MPGSHWSTNPLFARDGQTGEIYYAATDQLGTATALIKASGQIVWKADKTAFGKTTTTAENNNAGNPVQFNLRFPGQYEDTETGLHYNWHRYYDAEIGRYTNEDPIGLSGGHNVFQYAYANGVNNFDPDGRLGLVGGIIGAAIGGAANAAGAYFSGASGAEIARAAASGALVGLMMGATGGAAGSIGNWIGGGALGGGLTGGLTSLFNGGSFGEAAAAAMWGSAVGAVGGAFGFRGAVANGRGVLRKGGSVDEAIRRGDLAGEQGAALFGIGFDAATRAITNDGC